MRKTITGFPDKPTADAFVDGVLYVNDSAIEDIEVYPPLVGGGRLTDDDVALAGGWWVTFEDTDYYDEPETMPYVRGGMGI